LDDIGNKTDARRAVWRAASPAGAKWKRAIWLVSISAALVLAAATSDRALSSGGLRVLIAALKDPLALFAERSPGNRGPGPLIPTKGKAGPHERVLSEVRDRPTPAGGDTPAVVLDMPPVVDIPAGTLTPMPGEQGGTLPPEQLIGTPFVPAAPFGTPGFTPGENIPPPLFVGPVPPGGISPPGTPGSPQGPSGPPINIGTTPGGPGTPETPGGPTPPGGPPDTPPGTVVLPEPAPWTMMTLGVFALAVLRRRRPG
jgi:hypothetical protein